MTTHYILSQLLTEFLRWVTYCVFQTHSHAFTPKIISLTLNDTTIYQHGGCYNQVLNAYKRAVKVSRAQVYPLHQYILQKYDKKIFLQRKVKLAPSVQLFSSHGTVRLYYYCVYLWVSGMGDEGCGMWSMSMILREGGDAAEYR